MPPDLVYTFSVPELKENFNKNGSESQVKTEVLKDLRETQARVPENIKTWLQKIEEDPQQVTLTDDSGAVILQPADPQQPKVTLPMTRTSFMAGFKKKINDAGKWLSVFVLRLIKIKKGKVNFLEENDN